MSDENDGCTKSCRYARDVGMPESKCATGCLWQEHLALKPLYDNEELNPHQRWNGESNAWYWWDDQGNLQGPLPSFGEGARRRQQVHGSKR